MQSSKTTKSVIEIFEKNSTFYAVGFGEIQSSNKRENLQTLQNVQIYKLDKRDTKNKNITLKDRLLYGSVFLKVDGISQEGSIYSFDRGEMYPVKLSLKGDILEISIQKLFGPTLILQKLTPQESELSLQNRLETDKLMTDVF